LTTRRNLDEIHARLNRAERNWRLERDELIARLADGAIIEGDARSDPRGTAAHLP
jgi:hypothetical protein